MRYPGSKQYGTRVNLIEWRFWNSRDVTPFLSRLFDDAGNPVLKKEFCVHQFHFWQTFSNPLKFKHTFSTVDILLSTSWYTLSICIIFFQLLTHFLILNFHLYLSLLFCTYCQISACIFRLVWCRLPGPWNQLIPVLSNKILEIKRNQVFTKWLLYEWMIMQTIKE